MRPRTHQLCVSGGITEEPVNGDASCVLKAVAADFHKGCGGALTGGWNGRFLLLSVSVCIIGDFYPRPFSH